MDRDELRAAGHGGDASHTRVRACVYRDRLPTWRGRDGPAAQGKKNAGRYQQQEKSAPEQRESIPAQKGFDILVHGRHLWGKLVP